MSIKSGERPHRGSVLLQEIRNPTRHTPLPKQRQKMLSNTRNKANIADFLMNDWVEQCQEKLPADSKVFLAGGFHDFRKAVEVRGGGHARAEQLESDQEEADSRMFLHVSFVAKKHGVKRVLLWSIDTDVAVMGPMHCYISKLEEFFIRTGVGAKKRFIPLYHFALDIERNMFFVLPALHWTIN